MGETHIGHSTHRVFIDLVEFHNMEDIEDYPQTPKKKFDTI